LDEFIRRKQLGLFAAGAFPVRHVPGDPNIWTIQTRYGDTPEATAHGVTAEWIKCGRPDPGLGDLWFATPQIANVPFKARSC
jgi:hypothetical protein